MTEKTLFHVVLVGELATCISLDRVSAEIGMSIIERNGEFYAINWYSDQGQFVEGNEVQIKKGNPQDIILHPRAKREILDVLEISHPIDPDSIVSLYDMLKQIGRGL
ncbi:MAG: hypothetical protein JW779_10425 [Candidatus Thorarchaeota archaeon]|nr:hypothetical protein [Candidatus Thorarchaeota archaeon]